MLTVSFALSASECCLTVDAPNRCIGIVIGFALLAAPVLGQSDPDQRDRQIMIEQSIRSCPGNLPVPLLLGPRRPFVRNTQRT